jgi:hypothetical protein
LESSKGNANRITLLANQALQAQAESSAGRINAHLAAQKGNCTSRIGVRGANQLLRHEAEVALVHHFAVSIYTVWKWR